MIGIDSAPFLKINRVVVSGMLGCDIKLNDGLNIIKGEPLQGDATTSNNCGKTLFTDLIKYGLGDRDKFSKGEIAEKIQTLALEVELNDNVYTIIRDLNSYTARLSIFEGKYSKDLELEQPAYLTDPKTNFSDFLLDVLHIPNIRIPLSNKPGAVVKPITFQDFMRVFYMDQKNSFQEIMNKVQPQWLKTKLIQILLGMAKEEEEQLRLKIKELTDNIASKENEVNNITRFLKKSGEKSRLEIIEKRKEIYDSLNLIVSEIISLKQKMRGQHGITDELRENLDHLKIQISELQEAKNKIAAKFEDFQSLKNSLVIDREKLDKTREANFILSTIDFGQCPRCLQPITSQMRERENLSDCMLCGRPLVIKDSDVRILDKHNLVDEEIKEVDILLERYQHDLANLDIEINNLVLEKERVQADLDNQSSSFVSPFVDELERLLHERNKLSAQIELLEQQLKQWQLLEEFEVELTEYKTEIKKLQAALLDIDTRDDNKIKKLSDIYEAFLRGSQYPNLDIARISPDDLMPLVNGHPYTEDTGIGFTSVKVIGYHFSLLRFSIENPCYYPKFLMIDSPRQFDINPETYLSMLQQFLELERYAKNIGFQVILTTRDLPKELEPYVIERINSKNRMLLRPEGQREQSSPPW